MIYRGRRQESSIIRGKCAGKNFKNKNFGEAKWDCMFESLEKQAEK